MLPHEAIHMAGMGLLTSVLAPGVVLATRHQRLPSLGWLALPGFAVVHSVGVIGMSVAEPPPLLHVGADALLLAAAVGFWLPVLGAHRLDDVARCIYLFLAAPTLDLPAVVVVARGDSAGGLAMIVAMLPIGVVAVALTWRLMVAEERTVRLLEDSLIPEVIHADA